MLNVMVKKTLFIFIMFYAVITPSFAQKSLPFDHSFRKFLSDVQENSIKNRDWNEHDWRNYVKTELMKLPIADKDGFYKAVQTALKDLCDNHSFLINSNKPDEIKKQQLLSTPTSIIVEDGIGIITLSTFTDDNPPTETYIMNFHDKIDELKPVVSKGWIINIQSNLGGNMYPMLACLSDFFINKNLGGFYMYGHKGYEPKQKLTFDGKAFRFNDIEVLSYKNVFPIGTTTLPTVVLIGEKTGSSTEFLALALERQPNVTLAGQLTHGLATANELEALPDNLGHYMLTIANYLDINDMPLLSEKVEPSVRLIDDDNQITEAKKIILNTR